MSKYHFGLMVRDFDAWLAESLSPRTISILKITTTGIMMALTALTQLGILHW